MGTLPVWVCHGCLLSWSCIHWTGSSCLRARRLRLLRSRSAGARDSTSPPPNKVVRINAETGQGVQTAGWKQEYLETRQVFAPVLILLLPKLMCWDVPRPPAASLAARPGVTAQQQALGALLMPFPLFLPPGSAAWALPILAAFTSAITTSLVFCIASLCLIMHPPHTPYECFHPLSHSVSHIHSFSHSGHIIYSSQDATVCVLYLGCFNGSFRNI